MIGIQIYLFQHENGKYHTIYIRGLNQNTVNHSILFINFNYGIFNPSLLFLDLAYNSVVHNHCDDTRCFICLPLHIDQQFRQDCR